MYIPPIPVHAKVGLTTFLVTVVSYLLVTYVPQFHQGVSPAYTAFLASLATSLAGSVIAYWDQHIASKQPIP